ncbi:MAG: ATP-grasp domain-containing protein [Ignavibacteria bacterium]|nr:ATP-grasp domain-containing protein [Ignavibacteria bacterium]
MDSCDGEMDGLMTRKHHIVVVFNEPTVATQRGRQYISSDGKIHASLSRAELLAQIDPSVIDLSEVGVLEEREHVRQALENSGYVASLFNMNGNVQRLIDFITEKKPDVIFNLCESLANESIHEMHVAGLYELMGVPYTGAGAFALGSCLNKVRTKEILLAHQIRTPKFALISAMESNTLSGLGLAYPIIVKPSREDASAGIYSNSVVANESDLRDRIEHILVKFGQPAIVEEYIEGREINVAILGNNPPVTLPLSEIDFSGLPSHLPKIVTYNAKWMEATDEYKGTVGVCPAPLEESIAVELRAIALKAFRIMGCRDYARVDMRLTKANVPYVLEVNPNPDISENAGFARSARNYGLTFEQTVAKIVEHALERH